jgi:hypothetical protein
MVVLYSKKCQSIKLIILKQKLVCKDINITECYVGHTTDFKSRKKSHKFNCVNSVSKGHNFYVYQFIREHGNWQNWDMIEIEKFPCNDSLDACKRERYWVEYYKATLNSNIPSRTVQEWKEENKDKLLEYQIEYYKDNKEYCLDRQKKYYVDNKEHYTDYNKQYYIDNREYCLERQKIYGKEKITCDCGDIINKSSLFRHIQCKTHLRNMSKLN